MNKKEMQLAALEGKSAGPIPFAPRLDLWMIAHRARGTLPAALRGIHLPELAHRLGLTCHAFKADLTLPRPPEDYALLGFGLENHAQFPFRFDASALDLDFRVDGGRMATRVNTPFGDLRIEMEYTEQMMCDGISMPFVHRFPLRSEEDIDALCHVFETIRVIPTPGGFDAFSRHVGDQGLPVASGMPGASPMHLILHNLAEMETFWFLYLDEPEAMKRLASVIDGLFQSVLDATLASGARLFYWGSNYSQALTPPPFFREEIQPWLTYAARRSHEAGKLLLTHADGDNGPLLECLRETGVDILESVCTQPMIDIRMDDLRARTQGASALWGGIPSVVLMPDACDAAAFDRYLDDFFAQAGDGRNLVVGVSDNVPPDADLGRLRQIQARCADFPGGVV